MNRFPTVNKTSEIELTDVDNLSLIKLSRKSLRVQPQGPQINQNTGVTTIEFDLQVCTDQGRKLSIFRGSIKINNLLADELDLFTDESVVTESPIVPKKAAYSMTATDVEDTLVGIVNSVAELAPDWIS